LNGTLSITFIIQNFKITLRHEEFACILYAPCKGVCVYTPEWPISSLPNGVDSNPDIYPPPHEEPLLIHKALFYQRPPSKTRKVKGVSTTLDPFQMILSELKINFMKWETILNENVPFHLAYYGANRMVSVTKSADITLLYGMLLTRLFEHVHVAHPHAFSDDLYLVYYVMIPLSEKRVFRIMPNGKIPHLPTLSPPNSESSKSPSPSSHQKEEKDLVDNYTLDPITYIDQLLPIEGGESQEFKQTMGMFKCFSHFLFYLGKKK
nr:hypothetical protein [Tanacetum cinerariifolium]GEZ87672.1 hypothetical protein [Tanacetum cinerariifolium]